MATSSILGILESAAEAFGIPSSLFIAQATQESSLNPNAYNASSGATGLLQLEPATAAQYGLTGAALLDPAQNAAVGANYLADLYAQFGDWATALAAYDWGPGNVTKALNTYGASFLTMDPGVPAETQNYVANILGASGAPASSPAVNPAAGVPTPIVLEDDATAADSAVDDFSDAGIPSDTAASSSPNLPLLLLAGLALWLGVDLLQNWGE
jgi:membrane-bound lytic murein transglycosylase D